MNNRTKTDHALIDRYVYDVVRRLPKKQREDIELEIRSLIDDMSEESPSLKLEEILKSLGTPAELAKKYRDEEQYVIGPESYDSYWMIAKILGFCVPLGFLVSTILQLLTAGANRPLGFLPIVLEQLSSCLAAGFCAFGFLTLIYAILERRKIRVDFDSSANWEPSSLPPVPDKKGLIHRSETVVNIVFILIFMFLLLLTPELFGAWHIDGGQTTSVPALNLDIWPQVTPFLILFFGVSMIDEIIKLAAGRHCAAVAVSSTLCNLITVCLSIIILRSFPFWNPNFVTGLEEMFSHTVTSTQDILFYWDTPLLSNIILGIIVFASVLETGTAIYKAVRYGSMFAANVPRSAFRE